METLSFVKECTLFGESDIKDLIEVLSVKKNLFANRMFLPFR